LARVQGTFEHPILYGVFVSSALGLSWIALGHGRGILVKLFRFATISAATFFSLSTGPLTALAAQIFFLFWKFSTRRVKRRWPVLGGVFALAYLAVDLLSNRTPFHVFVTYLTFNVSSAYGRILIWDYGTMNVAKNPFFGVGMGEWERPSWMSSSMDNFWLVFAVQYGLPMCLMIIAAVILIVRKLSWKQLDDPRLTAARAGLLITIGGLVVAGATVHFWNATYVWFMFLLGSGMWLLDEGPDELKPKRRARKRKLPSSLAGRK